MKYFDLNTKYRVLLTETLPNELPILWDNSHFVYLLKENKAQPIIDKIISIGNNDTIPYDYHIRQKGGVKSRKLSIPHPLIQLQWCDLYESYGEYMTYLCGRSPFSLRYIYKKANYQINIDDLDLSSDTESPDYYDANWNKQYTNYFTYRKLNGIFKFYESEDILRLEQKYRYMLQTDVNGCFYHIYTHSIAWAVKGKEFAKEIRGNDATFENKVDTLMRRTNYGETNGVVVGAEFSRIFAEIIFQQIDIDLLNNMKNDYDYHVGKEYEIRRYVDDYFIFANNTTILENIKQKLIQHLEYYKLDLNQSKTSISERPFWTNISNAKNDISRLISDIFNTYFKHLKQHDKKSKKKNNNNTNANNSLVFSRFIKKYEYVLRQNDVQSSDVNSYLISIVKKNIEKWDFTLITTEYQESLVALVKICCFIYSMDMNFSDTTKLCLILNKLHSNIKVRTLKEEIDATINRELKRCIDIYLESSKKKEINIEINIEILNILIIWDRVSNNKLSTDRIAAIFGKRNKDDVYEVNFDYLDFFQIETLLYLMRDREDCKIWKQMLYKRVKRLFSDKMWKLKSDLFCLFLDLMVCPYLSKQEKKDIIKIAENFKKDDKAYAYLESITDSDIHYWFMNWDTNCDFERILEKKQYHSKYK